MISNIMQYLEKTFGFCIHKYVTTETYMNYTDCRMKDQVCIKCGKSRNIKY